MNHSWRKKDFIIRFIILNFIKNKNIALLSAIDSKAIFLI